MMNLDAATLEPYLVRLTGGPVQIERISVLGSATTGAAALKAFGYGRPLCIEVRAQTSSPAQPADLQRIVLRQVNRNGFGRERDSDRIAEVWLDWSTFNMLPSHVPARDIVALTHTGQLESLSKVADVLLVTDYATGEPYADDLLRIRDAGECTERDVARATALARYLAQIHHRKHDDPLLWRRRLRDLVGHGEGIMGLCDSYPTQFALASADDLRAIEDAANRWRWQLKPLHHRLCQVHGDFHPFNVLWSGDTFTVIDRSRGAWGEAADDVSAMTINYLFFSLQRSGTLAGPFEMLYRVFWNTYLHASQDSMIGFVIQPWFAWRALVLASPQWYPTLTDDVRRKLLTFARGVMTQEFFAWSEINQYLES